MYLFGFRDYQYVGKAGDPAGGYREARASAWHRFRTTARVLANFEIRRKNGPEHALVGVAGEAVLECPGDGETYAGERVAGAGDGFQIVKDFAGFRSEFEQEAFFAFFYMQRGGGVDKAVAGWGVYSLPDAAQVEGPEADGMDFYCDDLAWDDLGFGIGYADPAEIEHLPVFEGAFGGGEGGRAVTEERAGVIVSEAVRDAGRGIGLAGEWQKDRCDGREVGGGCEVLFDCEGGWAVKSEHGVG
jgi:hypothetical protein